MQSTLARTRPYLEFAARPVLAILAAGAVLAAFFASFVKALKALADEGLALEDLPLRLELLPCLVVFLVHLYYLGLVVREASFLRPFAYNDIKKLWLPILLCTAYIIAGIDASQGETGSLRSITLFTVIYSLWTYLDFGSHNDPTTGDAAKKRHRIWFRIDLLSTVVLGSAVALDYAQVVPGMTDISVLGTGLKDWVVAASVLFWRITRSIERESAQDNFAKHYAEYLKACVGGERSTSPNPGFRGLSQRRQHLHAIDFACSDSKRAVQTLEELGLPVDQIQFLRYDTDPKWSEDEIMSALAQSFTTHLQDAQEVARDADILIGSHVLYERRMTEDFIRIAEALKPGAYVIVRGYGANSFFASLLKQRAMSVLFPSPAHTWNESHLANLIARARVDNLMSWGEAFDGRSPVGPPCITIHQDIKVNESNRDDIHAVLQVLYGLGTAQVITEIVQRMQRENPAADGSAHLTNDDIVYVFKKKSNG